jgi:hypothetical protein
MDKITAGDLVQDHATRFFIKVGGSYFETGHGALLQIEAKDSVDACLDCELRDRKLNNLVENSILHVNVMTAFDASATESTMLQHAAKLIEGNTHRFPEQIC